MPQILSLFTQSNALPVLAALNRIVNALNALSDRVDPLSPTSNAGVVKVAVLTLTDAQIKALPTVAQIVAPLPGAGYRQKCLGVSLQLNTAAGAYTNLDGAAYLVLDQFGYWMSTSIANDSSLSTPLTALSDFLGQAHSRVYDLTAGSNDAVDAGGASGVRGWVQPVADAFQPDAATINNKGLYITAGNGGSGNWTGGNAANTLKVTVYYITEAL